MIGETAYDRRHGHPLGVIIGQRTATDAEGRPVEQWEIRSRRGVKFYMDKRDVRLESGSEPEPAPKPKPEPEAAPQAAAVEADERGQEWVEEEIRLRRSAGPFVLVGVGVLAAVVGVLLLASGLARRIAEGNENLLVAVPLLLGLLLILLGTNLIGEQSRHLAQVRKRLEAERANHDKEEAP